MKNNRLQKKVAANSGKLHYFTPSHHFFFTSSVAFWLIYLNIFSLSWSFILVKDKPQANGGELISSSDFCQTTFPSQCMACSSSGISKNISSLSFRRRDSKRDILAPAKLISLSKAIFSSSLPLPVRLKRTGRLIFQRANFLFSSILISDLPSMLIL